MQLPSDYTQACDLLLRDGRQSLNVGELAQASAKGWEAAGYAVRGFANLVGDDYDRDGFESLMLKLSKDPRSHDRSAEWAVSALALSDNARLDWLDHTGVGRRLDDVQRLVTQVFDIAHPPQDADAILRRAQACLANGALAVASEKGWEAATHAAKTYASEMGYDHIRSNYLSQVTRLLRKEPGGKQVGNWSMSASMLHENAAGDPDWLDTEIVRNDLKDVSKLVEHIRALLKADGNLPRLPNV